MIAKLWKFTLFFLLCLVIALLFNLPIQQVLPQLRLPNTIRLAGVDGTVIRGTAREIVVEDFPFYDVDYRYLPSCIPLLKICYRISYRQGTAQVAYDMLNGDTEVNGARLEYPVPELARYVPNLLVKPSGRLELIVDQMEIVGGKPSTLNGKLIWRDLGVDGDGVRFNIGDYRVDFNGDASQYAFKLSEIEGKLDVDGEGEVGADGQYRVDIRIVINDSIEPQVRNVLELAAKKISYNNYRIEQSGRLPAQIHAQIFP